MTARRKAMSLENFEKALGNRRAGGQVAGQGKWQRFIRDLEPRIPTRAVATGDIRWTQTYLRRAWQGSKAVKYRMVDEKGGTLKTTFIDGELWVVWYPEGSR